ncbi:hypothetical protein HMPREF1556_01199, partial [Porphyromonas sp. oral taxon 278 str. W7784]
FLTTYGRSFFDPLRSRCLSGFWEGLRSALWWGDGKCRFSPNLAPVEGRAPGG